MIVPIFFRMDPEENEVLDGLQEVELEIKNATARVSENLDEKFNELQISVGHINTNVLQMVQQCEVLQEVKEKVSEMSVTLEIASFLRQALTCRMCTAIPDTVLVVTVCCGQVAGCGPCVQTYANGNDTCLLCKTPMFASKLVFFRGLAEVLSKLNN